MNHTLSPTDRHIASGGDWYVSRFENAGEERFGLRIARVKLPELIFEISQVFELSVDGCKSDIGHFIESLELFHHELADRRISRLSAALEHASCDIPLPHH
jgi:hypothetical protein